MSWAKNAIAALQRGETVQIRPRGHSMRGKVNDGDLVTLEPCDPASLQVDDIVLVKAGGRDYLHLIKAVSGARFQIGNNRGHINGWVGHHCVYGKAVKVNDLGWQFCTVVPTNVNPFRRTAGGGPCSIPHHRN